MNDRCVSLLDNYDVEVLRTTKGRGAILCETNQGMLIFKEYIERNYSEKRKLHTEGVRKTAMELARKYGADEKNTRRRYRFPGGTGCNSDLQN